MTGNYVCWAFTATDDAISTWLSLLDQLPSSSSLRRCRTSKGFEGYDIAFEGMKGQVSLVNVHPLSQLWVLEATCIYAPVFHWLLRFSGGKCLPRKGRDTCFTRMVVSEVSAREIGMAQSPNITQTHAFIGPQLDLAIATYEIHDQGDWTKTIVAYWAKTRTDSYLVIAEEDLFSKQIIAETLLENWRTICCLPACNEMPSEIGFVEIFKYR